jgi:chorismate-pyruvate lyase
MDVSYGNFVGGMHTPTSFDRLNISEILTLTESTTFYLERLAGRQLHVAVTAQHWVRENGQPKLQREALLYLEAERPLIFSVSLLEPEAFGPRELWELWSGINPLGRILDPTNTHSWCKVNISFACRADHILAARLKTTDLCCYGRIYDLFLDGQKVGRITEYFNEESIARICQ